MEDLQIEALFGLFQPQLLHQVLGLDLTVGVAVDADKVVNGGAVRHQSAVGDHGGVGGVTGGQGIGESFAVHGGHDDGAAVVVQHGLDLLNLGVAVVIRIGQLYGVVLGLEDGLHSGRFLLPAASLFRHGDAHETAAHGVLPLGGGADADSGRRICGGGSVGTSRAGTEGAETERSG